MLFGAEDTCMVGVGRACLFGDFLSGARGWLGGLGIGVVGFFLFFWECCAKDFYETGWVL